jgi:hypothetical protein
VTPPKITITSEQRDALYGQILGRLSAIGDVWHAVVAKNWAAAERLGREFSDDLRLVLDDLGWDDGPGGETIELTTPPDVLRRVFTQPRDEAINEAIIYGANERGVRAEIREIERRSDLVVGAAWQVLADLDGDQ